MKNNICISISEKPGNFGKIIHNAGYEELGLDWVYIPFKITNLDFEEVIQYPSQHQVLMFVDPPYFSVSQEDHYIHTFTENDHKRLAKALKKTKH